MNNPVSHYMYLVTEEKLRITETGVKEKEEKQHYKTVINAFTNNKFREYYGLKTKFQTDFSLLFNLSTTLSFPTYTKSE